MIKLFTKKRKGFTLVELIVVVAILGILAAIAVPKLIGTQDAAKVKADIATARAIASAVSIAQAEGKAGVDSTPTVDQLVTAEYLDKAPKSAQNGGEFKIDYVSGKSTIEKITITTPTNGSDAGTSQVYPIS